MSELANSCVADEVPPKGLPGGETANSEKHEKKWPWVRTWVMVLSIAALVSSLLVMWTHGQRGFFAVTLATVVCVLAALFDAWTTRIPNWLTYIAILAGLAVNGAASICTMAHWDVAARWIAGAGIAQSAMGFGVCAGVGILGMVVARVGGGDIKLLAAIGAMLGLANVGSVLILALTVAVVYAVANLAVVGRLNMILRIASLRLLELLYFRRFQTPVHDEMGTKASMIPMAVPLAMGLVLSQVIDLHAFYAASGGR